MTCHPGSFALLLAAALAPASSGPLQSPEDSAPLRYRIEASAHPDSGYVRGRARLRLSSEALWSPGEVRLDRFSAGTDSAGTPRLSIESISANRAIRTVDDSDVVRVLLEQPLEPGGTLTLNVTFRAAFNPDLLQLLGYHTFWSDEPGSYWYPDVVIAGGQRVRFKDFDVVLEYPSGYGIVTSGEKVGDPERDGGRARATYRADHVEGFSIHLGEGFETMTVAGDGYTIVGLLPPDDPEPFRRVVRLASETVDWYRKTYGFFPVRGIGVVPGPKRWGGGFPLPNVFLIHRAVLDESFLRWITAHELGHYFWGLYVLSASEERLDWLNLANGIWIDHFYLAESEGVGLEEVWRRADAGDPYADFFQAGLENREQRLGLAGGGFGFDYNSWIRHSKAAIGVYLQTRRLGTQRFLELQREIIRDYRYRPLPLQDFVARLEAAGAPGAADFFHRWAAGDARLEYEVARVESERVPQGWSHLVTVRQLGTVAADVEIELVGADGKRERRMLAPDSFRDAESSVEVRMSGALGEVRLDPDGDLPMWNSSHPAIRHAWLRAMWRADLTGPFLDLAAEYLNRNPADDDVLYMLGDELFTLERHSEVVGLLERPAGDPATACAVRSRCRAAILLARSLDALGRGGEAGELLDAIRDEAGTFRLGSPWQAAREAIGGN